MIQFLKKYFLIFFLIFFTVSCSKDFSERTIKIDFPKNIVKIKGKYSVYIPSKKIILEKKFESADCESWAVRIDIDSLYRDSVTKLLLKMFEDIKFDSKQIKHDEIIEKGYISQITLDHEDAVATFHIEKNTAKFRIYLESNIIVYGNSKKIENSVNSNNSWDKNIFLSCNLNEGAHKAAEEAIERLINQIHSSIYESIYKMRR